MVAIKEKWLQLRNTWLQSIKNCCTFSASHCLNLFFFLGSARCARHKVCRNRLMGARALIRVVREITQRCATQENLSKSGQNSGSQIVAEQIKMQCDKTNFNKADWGCSETESGCSFSNVAVERDQVGITQDGLARWQIILHFDKKHVLTQWLSFRKQT